MLDSTLKQSSLCPGDGSTTFICTASGTELVWIVGGRRELSFNHNASVGVPRINPEYGGIIAILMRIENPEENGYAVRVSVLTVGAQPQATEMLSVKCHNGFNLNAKMMEYLPRRAGM